MSKMSGQGFVGSQANLTPEQIKAHGEVRTRIAILWFVGVICSILAIGGLVAFFICPASSKDIWVFIGPIISAGISGAVTFFAAQRSQD